MSCARCRLNNRIAEAEARGDHNVPRVLCDTGEGVFLVQAAELFLRYRPRAPVKISARSLDNYFRSSEWSAIEEHLAHVDNAQPGIMATLREPGKRPRLYLIEGFHRATNHRRDRSDWSCHVLTEEESNAIFAPRPRCRRKHADDLRKKKRRKK